MSCDLSTCGCPFCSPRKISLGSMNFSKTLGVWILISMLLLRGTLAASVIVKPKPHRTQADNNLKHTAHSDVPSQKMRINASEATNCAVENCYCYPTGKCKPCSRLDMGKQLAECLLTGYKQRAYCPTVKREQFVSCHYVPNPNDSRTFWLFEGSAVSVGVIAYAIVYLRQRRIEKMVERRIQQQINA